MDELDKIILSGANKVKITIFQKEEFIVKFAIAPSQETMQSIDRIKQWQFINTEEGKQIWYNLPAAYDHQGIAVWVAKQLRSAGKSVEVEKQIANGCFEQVVID